MEVTVRKSAFGRMSFRSPFQRAPCHRRGKAQARQRFQRGEVRQRAAQQRGGKQRVAQHHCAPAFTASRFARRAVVIGCFGRFFLAASAWRARRAGIAYRASTMSACIPPVQLESSLFSIVFQQNATGAGRHLRADARRQSSASAPATSMRVRPTESASPSTPPGEAAPAGCCAMLPLHQILVVILCEALFNPLCACGSRRISRWRTICSSFCFVDRPAGLISLAISMSCVHNDIHPAQNLAAAGRLRVIEHRAPCRCAR